MFHHLGGTNLFIFLPRSKPFARLFLLVPAIILTLGSCDFLNPADDDAFETIHEGLVIVTANSNSVSLTNTTADTAYYQLFNPCALVMWVLCDTPAKCQSLGTVIAPEESRQFAFSEALMWNKESPCVAVAYWFLAIDGTAPPNYKREHETMVEIILPGIP